MINTEVVYPIEISHGAKRAPPLSLSNVGQKCLSTKWDLTQKLQQKLELSFKIIKIRLNNLDLIPQRVNMDLFLRTSCSIGSSDK